MIKQVSFVNSCARAKFFSKCSIQQKPINKQLAISFSGIMDNPDAKRVQDENGNIYIVESGGKLTVYNKEKENNNDIKNTLRSAGTGAGLGVAGTSVATKAKANPNDKTQTAQNDDLKPHETSKIDDKDINDSDDETNAARSKDYKEVSGNTDYANNDNIDDDIDDIDDSIFDNDSPIYEF